MPRTADAICAHASTDDLHLVELEKDTGETRVVGQGRLDAPAWLARTQLEQARLLRTRAEPGDADWARQLLGQALATARVAALPKVEQDVGDELRRLVGDGPS